MSVSSEKAEKVVKAPSPPTTRASRAGAGYQADQEATGHVDQRRAEGEAGAEVAFGQGAGRGAQQRACRAAQGDGDELLHVRHSCTQ